jgi:predicted NBD/HSP70 family sugar kinase
VFTIIYTKLKGNFDLMKIVNLQNVLHAVLNHHPISRAKISSLLGINKVTVSQCIDLFLEKGIVCEIGTTGAARGRPATLVDINRSAGVLIGIDTELHESRILVTDLSGQELERETIPLLGPEPERFLEFLSSRLSVYKHKYEHLTLGIIGLGMALPGHYNFQTGIIEHIANLQTWNGFQIRNELSKLNLGFSVFLMNIANAGVLGEVRFGKANDPKNLVYINGTWGLGVGVCTDGNVLLGDSGFAGRLGHSIIHFNGKKCTCGKRGCWEAYASVRSLYGSLFPDKPYKEKYMNEILLNLEKNDPKTVNAIHDLGYYLGLGLINVINAYNPAEICLGGFLGQIGTPLINQIKVMFEEYLPKHFWKDLNIYCSELGNLSVAYGAVSVVRDNLLQILLDNNIRDNAGGVDGSVDRSRI